VTYTSDDEDVISDLVSVSIFDGHLTGVCDEGFAVLQPLVPNVGNAESLAGPRHVVLLVDVHVADRYREDRSAK
jgi:hypothetical protein